MTTSRLDAVVVGEDGINSRIERRQDPDPALMSAFPPPSRPLTMPPPLRCCCVPSRLGPGLQPVSQRIEGWGSEYAAVLLNQFERARWIGGSIAGDLRLQRPRAAP